MTLGLYMSKEQRDFGNVADMFFGCLTEGLNVFWEGMCTLSFDVREDRIYSTVKWAKEVSKTKAHADEAI